MPRCLQLPVKEYRTDAVRPPRSLSRIALLRRLCWAQRTLQKRLFAGSERGGRTATILFSFASTCRALKIDLFASLRDVLDRVCTHPARRIGELLPDRWHRFREGRGVVAG
jgi:hypothetical protein